MFTQAQNSQSASPIPDLLSQFRVRTVAEIIDVAFRVYRRNFLDFLLIIVLTAIPLQLLSYAADIFILGRYEQTTFSDFSTTGSFSSSVAASNVVTQVGAIKDYIEKYLLYFAQWALTSALVTSIFGGVVTLRSAYGSLTSNFRRAIGLIGLQALITLAIYSPMLFVLAIMLSGNGGNSSASVILVGCVSPFVTITNLIVAVRLKLALPAAVIEGLSPREAIRRSFNLTRNYWWRTVALVTVLGILSTVVAAGPAALVTALFGFGFKDIYASLAIARLVGILTNAFFAPIEMAAIAFYYYDQRVRREGFDIESAIDHRYSSGAYGQAPAPSDYQYDPATSYSSYGQPNLGYPYTPLSGTETPHITYYDEPSQREPNRVRRISVPGTPISPDLPTPSEGES